MKILIILCAALICVFCDQNLWQHGKIYFTINPKDYDVRSQEAILSTIMKLEKEICLKFFHLKQDINETVHGRVLFFTNPQKQKDCGDQDFNYDSNVVEMAIGYRCIDDKNIAKKIVEMLMASISEKDFKEAKKVITSSKETSGLIPMSERHFINEKYETECRSLTVMGSARRQDTTTVKINKEFYNKLVWPRGMIFYEVEPDLVGTIAYDKLQFAMGEIQRGSCIIFEKTFDNKDVMPPKSLVKFGFSGYRDPPLGYRTTLNIDLQGFATGAPGHAAHVINNLMRMLGVYMMSNRHDRDSFVKIDWDLIEQDERLYLDQAPRAAFINTSYSFSSVTHAPTNYKCGSCTFGEQSVSPVNDFLWNKSLTMGKIPYLNDVDKEILELMYGDECHYRETIV